jgi:hypothetical protein
MAYYSRGEQETVCVFDIESGSWKVYTCVPKHIRKVLAITSEITRLEADENGRTIAVEAVLTDKQIRIVQGRSKNVDLNGDFTEETAWRV